MTISVGLFGAGRIGRVHALNVTAHSGSVLRAVTDVAKSAAQEVAAATGATAVSPEAILQDPQIDAVIIASSTNTHADLIEAAIASGKAVFCEKPVDLDLDRARACLAKVEAQDKPVMMGFNRRFDPNFARLKSAFDRGEIGRGELLSITSFDPAPPPIEYIKVSGGLFRDMSIHDFDLACWLLGASASKVTAIASCLVDPAISDAGDVDTAAITLQFDSGQIAVIKNSRRAVYGYDQRLELLGERGLLSAQNVVEDTVMKSTAEGVVAAKPEHFFLERYALAYRVEWAAFVDAVLNESPVPVSVREGVHALAIAEAANRSLHEGRRIDITSVMVD